MTLQTAPDPRVRTPRPAPSPVAAAGLGLGIVVAGLVLLADVPVAVRCVLTLLLVVVVPVVALLGSPGRRTPPGPAEVVTAAGGAVLVLLVLGLVLNTVLPVLGIDRALGRTPVVVALVALDLALVGWRHRQGVDLVRPLRQALRSVVLWRAGSAEALGLAALVVCVAGAVRLNNGAGSAVAVVGHVLVAATFAALLLRPARSRSSDAVSLYLAAAALLLGTSVRGWYVIGHDIQREFLVYLLAQDQDRWQMSSLDSAYNACLSVSILPTVLANLTGLGGIVVFKVVLQLCFALVPVAVYCASRGWAGRRVALLGVLVLVTFPTFHNDMPYLVRQEIAFLFLALALLTASRHDLRRRTQLALVVGFGVGVVLSHYSTTYLLLLGLGLGTVGFHLARWRADRRTAREGGARTGRERPVMLAPVVIAVVGVATWTWVGPVTQSGGHLEETVTGTVAAVLDGSSGPGSSDLSYGLFAGQQASPDERLAMFAAEALDARGDDDEGWLLDDEEAAAVTPRTLDVRDDALTPVGAALDAVGVDVTAANSMLRFGSALLLQVLLLAGVALLVLVRARPRPHWRVLGRLAPPSETLWLVLGAIAAMGLVVVVPGLSASYGVLRAFQQGLLVFAPVIVVGAVGLLGLLLARAVAVAAVGFVGLFLVLSGVVSTTTGGAPGQLALANSGQYYDLYYLTDAEASGTRWLARAARSAPVQSEIVTDKVAVGRLRSVTGGQVLVSGDFFPTQLRRDTFVFLGAQTVQHRQATVFYTGNLITYAYPVDLLTDRLDLVYSNPDAEVFR